MLYTHPMTTGSRIRKLRSKAGLSQEKFGELFGVTKGMVSQWESDLVTPPPDRLIDMKKKLHPCPVNGKTRGSCPGYVVDHIKALKRGGADQPYNMQWQTVEEAKLKDRWE